jgi:hypothetical protein
VVKALSANGVIVPTTERQARELHRLIEQPDTMVDTLSTIGRLVPATEGQARRKWWKRFLQIVETHPQPKGKHGNCIA